MNTWIRTGVLSLAVLGLAACATEPADAPAEEPMAEEPMTEEPMAEEPMAEEPMAEEATATSQAESDCLTAVAEQVGVASADLSVLSAEMGETSTTVMVEVPEAAAPWQCNWGFQDGEPAVLEVFFSGDEGAM